MALHYDLPVYRDTFRLILLIYQYTQDFPRDYKYTLGQDMKHDCMNLTRSIYRANRTQGDKTAHIENFLEYFELVKLEIRLCIEIGETTGTKMLSLKKQAELHKLMESIGKQAEGWRKAQSKPKSKA